VALAKHPAEFESQLSGGAEHEVHCV
jgi:hypothetical protein